MAVPVVGPGIAPGGAPSGGASGGMHTVGVAVKFHADPTQASKAMQSLTQDAEKLAAAGGKAQQALAGTGAGAGGRPGGVIGNAVPPGMRMPNTPPPGMSGGPGFMSGMGDSLSRFVAAGALISTWANGVKVLNDLDDAFVSTREKARSLAGVIPVVGGMFQTMFDAFIIIRDRLTLGDEAYNQHRDRVREHGMKMNEAALRRQGDYQIEAAQVPAQNARIEADVFRRSMLPSGWMDGNAPSPWLINTYAEQDRALSPEARMDARTKQDDLRREAAAQRGVDVAGAQAMDQQGRMHRAVREANEAERAADAQRQRMEASKSDYESGDPSKRSTERKAIVGGLFGPLGSWYDGADDPVLKTKHEEEILNLQQLEAEVLEKKKHAQEEITKNQQTQISLVQKENELQQAKVRTMQSQLAILERERGKIEGAAADFTLMAPDRQAAIMQAQQRLKEKGIDSLTAEQRESLQGFGLTNEALREQATADARERAGKPGDRFGALLRDLGKQDLKTIEAQIAQTRIQIDGKLALDEAQTKGVIAKIIKDSADQIGAAVESEVKVQIGRMNTQQAAGKAQLKVQ